MLVPLYCEKAPAWYDLPKQGVPDRVWMAGGGPEPSTQYSDLRQSILMDPGHDYRIEDGRIRYMYSGGAKSWILLQYGEVGRKSCEWCSEEISTEANFCPFCGTPQ